MKKVAKVIFVSLIFCLMLAGSVLGNEWTWENSPGHHGSSMFLDRSIKSSKDTINRYGKGEILSEGTVEIVNEQDGQIYINIHTLAHKDVDRIRHVIFLDQWDESRNDWAQVDYLDYSRTKEEEADGKLSYLMHSITITGYPVNKYYRVRGMHLVEFNGDIETCSTVTHGVLITKN